MLGNEAIDLDLLLGNNCSSVENSTAFLLLKKKS